MNMEVSIITVFSFVIIYTGIGVLLYLPLHYTKGLPDSFGARERYKETLKTAGKCVIKILRWLIE